MSQVYVLNFEVTADTKRKLMEMLHGKTFEEFVDMAHKLWEITKKLQQANREVMCNDPGILYTNTPYYWSDP